MASAGSLFLSLADIVNVILSRFAVAFVILLIGLAAGKLLGKLIQKVLQEIDLDKTIKEAVRIRVPLTDIISTGVTYLIYFIAIVMALDNLGVATQVLNIISIGVLIILILFIFLGVKDFLPNALAGMFLHRKKFLHEGDRIRIDDVEGKIIYLNLVETRIETREGDIIYIPNSQMTTRKVRKLSSKKKK
jgi:small-conductance mechanosensitive channel